MAVRKRGTKRAQAWIALKADDPEALSTLDVARAHLAAGKDLESVRRLRLFELSGRLPGAEELGELLHQSTQFYNPHKESCTVRLDAEDAAPLEPEEWLVIVVERGGDRRPAAERWWHHETGKRIEVREGVGWALRFGRAGESGAKGLAELRDRAHGILCNPHSQDSAIAHGEIPIPLWTASARVSEPKGENA